MVRSVRVETRWRPGRTRLARQDRWRKRSSRRSGAKAIALRVSRRGASVVDSADDATGGGARNADAEEKEADTSKKLRCPMPGLVVSIAVAEGQKVAAGETLAVVEAMKMENVLRAERSGDGRAYSRQARRQPRCRRSHPGICVRPRRMPQTRTIKVRISGLVQGVGFRAWTRAAGERARPLGLGEELRERRC